MKSSIRSILKHVSLVSCALATATPLGCATETLMGTHESHQMYSAMMDNLLLLPLVPPVAAADFALGIPIEVVKTVFENPLAFLGAATAAATGVAIGSASRSSVPVPQVAYPSPSSVPRTVTVSSVTPPHTIASTKESQSSATSTADGPKMLPGMNECVRIDYSNPLSDTLINTCSKAIMVKWKDQGYCNHWNCLENIGANNVEGITKLKGSVTLAACPFPVDPKIKPNGFDCPAW